MVSTEIGQATNYSTSLNFLNNLIVAAQRPSAPALSSFYSKAYFQNTTQGNCDNGNCACNCNCGDLCCTNCTPYNSNCANCDTQNWLQTNCNCACTYNCNVYTNISYNCSDCCCVVATALTDSGLWSQEQYKAINRWAVKHLDKSWLGLRLHRGYHMIAPTYWIPHLTSNSKSLMSKYLAWTFTNGTNMLMGKPYNKLSIPNSLVWIVVMTITGFCSDADKAEQNWQSIYQK